jgi:PIN domain nuclease of toxin-antitoxin system
MRLLLDTHVFLWWNSADPRLPQRMRDQIANPANQVFVSAASVWEIAIKRATGTLAFTQSVVPAIDGHGFSRLPIALEHAEWAGSLPALHRDPFDCLLVAQAQLEGLTLVTIDEEILRYQVPHL